MSTSRKDIQNGKEMIFSFITELATVAHVEGLLNVIHKYIRQEGFEEIPLLVVPENHDHTFQIHAKKSFIDFAAVSISHLAPIVNYSFPDKALGSFTNADSTLHINIESLGKKTDSPLYIKALTKKGIKNAIGFPLQYRGQSQGCLYLLQKIKSPLSEKKLKRMQEISKHASFCLANILAFESVAQIKKEKDILLLLSREIASIHSKMDLMPFLRKKLSQNGFYSDLAISIINEDQKTTTGLLIDWRKKRHADPDYLRESTAKHNLQDGLFNAVLKSKIPVEFDLQKILNRKIAPSYIQFLYAHGIRYMMCITLIHRDKAFGFFHLFSKRKKIFSDSQKRLLTGISDQVGNAVSNIIIQEAFIERERENAMLLDFSRKLASVRNKTDLLQAIHNNLKNLFPATDFVIGLINKDTNTHSAYLQYSETNKIIQPEFIEIAKMQFSVNDGICDKTLEAEDPVLWNLEEVMRWKKVPGYIPFWNKYGYKNMVSAAIRNKDEKLGYMYYVSRDDYYFQKKKLDFLKSISYHLAMAVANVIANEKASERELEKSLLLSLSKEITSSRSKEDIQNIIENKLGSIFEFNAVSVYLLHANKVNYTNYLYSFPQEMINHPELKARAAEKYSMPDGIYEVVLGAEGAVIFDMDVLMRRKNVPGYVDFFYKNGIKEMVGFPIKINHQSIGGLFIHAKKKNSFSKSQLFLTEAIVSHIAIAISNIRALEKIEAQLDEINLYKSKLQEENRYLQQQIIANPLHGEIIGTSPKMKEIFDLINRVAPTDSSVLIEGETGTGKELIARAIHKGSPRKNELMVKVNCAALPPSLIESELFGHEKGSFTGAFERRIGKFELANNGTLFLDEIGEMPLELQVKLLRALQEKEIERVGGKSVIKINTRIITATNKDLKYEISQGKFRSDLYYRLNVFPVILPPLRERRDDIPMLATALLNKLSLRLCKKMKNFSADAMKQMMQYDWPGNIRELEHLIERSLLMANGTTIKEVFLSTNNKSPDDRDAMSIKTINEIEREHILSALHKTNGRIRGKEGAAELLKLPPTTLHSKMKKLGIQKLEYKRMSS